MHLFKGSEARWSTWMHLVVWGLLLLALPVLLVWHAHLGYPLRLLTATLAVPLLDLAGLAVTREGTVLLGPAGGFDVAESCSGVRKLWAALFLACALGAFRRLGARRTILLAGAAVLAALAGNVLRVTTLFYVEIIFAQPTPLLRDGAGLISFAVVVGLVLAVAHALGRPGGEPGG